MHSNMYKLILKWLYTPMNPFNSRNYYYEVHIPMCEKSNFQKGSWGLKTITARFLAIQKISISLNHWNANAIVIHCTFVTYSTEINIVISIEFYIFKIYQYNNYVVCQPVSVLFYNCKLEYFIIEDYSLHYRLLTCTCRLKCWWTY